MVFKIIFVSFLCSLFYYGQAQIGMGPLNIKLIRFSECPADEQHLTAEIKSRDDGFDGMGITLDMPFPMDDQVSYNIRVDKVQNGQVQKGVFKHSGPDTCVNLKKFLGQFYEKLAVEMQMGADCPVPAGSYSVDNFKFDQNDTGLKTFLYGRFLLYAEFVKDGKKMGCVCLEFTNSRPGESV